MYSLFYINSRASILTPARSTKSKTLKAEQTSLIQHFYFINFAELTRGRKKIKNEPFQDQRGYKQLLSSVFLSFFSKDY